MRWNDGRDPEHGLRGAEYAKSLLNKEYQLTAEQFDLLYEACQHHNKRKVTENKTIGTCWDADKLDLRRVNIRPLANYMHTNEAKRIIKEGKWQQLEKREKRTYSSLKNILYTIRWW
jgi:uncharacterized protein